MGSECEASDHTGGWAVDGDLTGKDVRLSLQGMRGHGPLARHRTKRCQDEGTNGPYHSTRKGLKHQEQLGGGLVGEPEWTRPDVGLAEAHGWRSQWTGWYYIGTQ